MVLGLSKLVLWLFETWLRKYRVLIDDQFGWCWRSANVHFVMLSCHFGNCFHEPSIDSLVPLDSCVEFRNGWLVAFKVILDDVGDHWPSFGLVGFVHLYLQGGVLLSKQLELAFKLIHHVLAHTVTLAHNRVNLLHDGLVRVGPGICGLGVFGLWLKNLTHRSLPVEQHHRVYFLCSFCFSKRHVGNIVERFLHLGNHLLGGMQ